MIYFPINFNSYITAVCQYQYPPPPSPTHVMADKPPRPPQFCSVAILSLGCVAAAVASSSSFTTSNL